MRQACQLPPFSSILSVYNLIYSIKTSILSSFQVTKGVAKNRLCMLILRENSIEEEIIQQMRATSHPKGPSHRFLQGFKGHLVKLDMLSSHTSTSLLS
ncbi:Uncharacterized protein HZ326_5633 [Fusarium oxysporum f. sp. albedinis]|nr:Uncharacterized protein HZ326_5633 [Fusarium oxysporum f. sp. albedinis]